VLWGTFIMAFPALSARVYGFAELPREIHLWQGAGLFIALLGIGYALAASDPRQHWGIVLIGLLAKVFGAAGMCWSVFSGQVSSQVLWLLPFNDVIWLWPFWRIVQDGMTRNSGQWSHRSDVSD
jgi:hypothetical protein